MTQTIDIGAIGPRTVYHQGGKASGRVRRVNEQDVADLYVSIYPQLLGLANLVAPEDGMAEDLVQEAFIRVVGARRRVDELDRLDSYFRVTIINLARSRGRRLGIAKRSRQQRPNDMASAEDNALRLNNQIEVTKVLRTLPTRQRECLVLRFYQEMTESQIADTLGISIGSVRTHVKRGMKAMSRSLAHLAKAHREGFDQERLVISSPLHGEPLQSNDLHRVPRG